jgi:hypothetical protein
LRSAVKGVTAGITTPLYFFSVFIKKLLYKY